VVAAEGVDFGGVGADGHGGDAKVPVEGVGLGRSGA
jgi:hypothetical protein